jgi:hypothetical protein
MVAAVVARKVDEHRRKVDMVHHAHASPTHMRSPKIDAPGSPMRSPKANPARNS